MKKKLFLILAGLLLVSSSVTAQETKFFTSFEFGSFGDEPEGIFAPSDINGADDQIGDWIGNDIPDAVGGDIVDPPEQATGFVNNPYGGRMLVVDRPGGDLDTGEDFQGIFGAELTDPILLLGAEVSFEMGVRRTNGNNNKDYDIVGRGSDGSESFRVRVGTNNNSGERLGYVTNDGADVVFDLPTVSGDDGVADLNNTGYNRNLEGPYADVLGGINPGAELPFINISLSQAGYVISLAHDEANTTAEANAYVSETLPYNGNATDLAVVEFEYAGAGATGRNSGWFLDNVTIAGFEEILQGDFNFDGTIDFGDFLILSSNFGTESSEGDYDFNGVVNLADFAQLKAAFNAGSGEPAVASVPEPSSIMLIALAMLAGLSFRKQR